MLQDSFKEEQIPEEVENAVIPLVWANEVSGRSRLAEPVTWIQTGKTKTISD